MRACIRASERPASVRWIVFPRWEAGAGLTLEPVSKAQAFLELATHAFNYESLGFAGFETVKGLIERSSCWRLQYSNLDDAVRVLQDLSSQPVR